MIPNYQVRFKDTLGAVTHVLAGTGTSRGGLKRVYFENVVNGSGSHRISLRGDMSIGLEVGLDYQVEVWKKPVGLPSWKLVYEGLHRTWTWQADNDGDETFTSYGSGYNSLLARRIVAAYATTTGSDKSDKAETVIKEFVNENIGPGAVARALTGLTVQADSARGNDWEGSRAWQNLLEVCQDIAKSGGGDFAVIGTGPATFEFRWYDGQLGVDRTLGNAGGNDPIIFSLQRNNMLTPLLSLNHGQEFNTVYVLGQGEGVARTVVVTSDPTSIAYSPWNLIEVSRQATGETTTDGLETVGAQELSDGLADRSVTFEAAQTPDCAFGVHYNLGDIITAMYHQRVDKKITKVTVDVGENDESINLELADVP